MEKFGILLDEMLGTDQMEMCRSRKFETEIKNLIGGLIVREKFSEIKDPSLKTCDLKPETWKDTKEWIINIKQIISEESSIDITGISARGMRENEEEAVEIWGEKWEPAADPRHSMRASQDQKEKGRGGNTSRHTVNRCWKSWPKKDKNKNS